MIRLLLLRHAKSSWETPGPDFDRPLNLRGRAAAPLMGRHMADHGLVPDRVLCSGARRTRETFASILPHLPGDMEVSILRAIYDAPDDGYPALIARHGGRARTLLLVGHNPAIQACATALIGRGNPDLIEQIGLKFPTASLAVIHFDRKDWAGLEPGTGRVVAFFRPRELEVVGEAPTDEGDD